MECTVEYDGLRRRWVRRWAKSPIRDEQVLSASVTRPNRACGVDDLLLAQIASRTCGQESVATRQPLL